VRELTKDTLALTEDWYGDNAAITCFACGKVFLVSRILHRKGRACPACGTARAIIVRSRCFVTESCDPPGLNLVKAAGE
jgi:peptide subunit release factor 1 (eRF1)